MSEQVVPVTGALAGIGRATATAFAHTRHYPWASSVGGTDVTSFHHPELRNHR
jgi:NAD(P)-dependent dehydrogenase (short-subunit alcohol dehydrogenase family)